MESASRRCPALCKGAQTETPATTEAAAPARARARRTAAPRASISRGDAPEARPPPLRLVFEGGGEAGS